MRLRTRLALMVVIGLLLIVASVVYVGGIPLPAQAQGTDQGRNVVASHSFSCAADESGGCALKKAGGGCLAGGGRAMEETAKQDKSAGRPEAAKPKSEKQSEKVDIGAAR